MSGWITNITATHVLVMLGVVLALYFWANRRGERERQLHRLDLGDAGPRCVFLHGLGGTHRYWLRALREPSPQANIALVDLLGFGDSPKPWCRHTMERHLDKLQDILAGERDLTLVGHSLGAALALAYAARHPGQVRRLVLLSLPHFGGQAAAYRWLRQTPEGWIVTNVVLMSLVCVFTRRVVGKLVPYLRRDLPREIAEDVVKHTWLASTTSLWDVIYRHDLKQEADALAQHISVICIHGSDDMTVPADPVCRLAAGRSNWTAITLPDVDHHPWLRAPRLCQDFIFGASAAIAPGDVLCHGFGCAANSGVNVRA